MVQEWEDEWVEIEEEAPTKVPDETMSGYCALCRAMEIAMYGTVIGEPGYMHNRACEKAGCTHPYEY